MKNFKFLVKTLLTISSLFLLLGCQQYATPATPANQTSTTATPATNQTSTDVAIQNFAFDQANLTVAVGTKVKWTNNDSVPHTATSDTGAFDSGNLTKGQSFEFTFDKEGTYAYYCSVHPSMRGTITVNKASN